MMKALIPIIVFLAGFYLYTFLKYRKKKRNLKTSSECQTGRSGADIKEYKANRLYQPGGSVIGWILRKLFVKRFCGFTNAEPSIFQGKKEPTLL